MLNKRSSPCDSLEKPNLKKIKTEIDTNNTKENNVELKIDLTPSIGTQNKSSDRIDYGFNEYFSVSEANPTLLNQIKNKPFPFFIITDILDELEFTSGTGKQKSKISLIKEIFILVLKSQPEILGNLFLFFHSKLFPGYKNRKFDIGKAFLIDLAGKVTKKPEKELKKKIKTSGSVANAVYDILTSLKNNTIEDSNSRISFDHWRSEMISLTSISKPFCLY